MTPPSSHRSSSLAEIHNAKEIVEKLFAAFQSSEGAEVSDGLRLFVSSDLTLKLSTDGNDRVIVSLSPPPTISVTTLRFLSFTGTIERVVISRDSVVAEIDGLPDKTFRIVS